jgi:outer membrane receptor protein involved in Fe transport
MKKYIILSLIITTFTINNFASEPEKGFTISGKVIDAVSNSAVEYSSVAISNSDGEIINGTLTDEQGVFEIANLKKGQYTLLVSFMGYEKLNQRINVSEDHDFGLIKLNPDADMLKDVEVVSERSTFENRLDKKVITVGKDLVTSGTNALEIMDNIPSISKDENGNIMLRGNQNIQVLVNGKPTNIKTDQLLKQIPSNTIEKIEVITNPSAKYNAQNEAGIINIILKKQDMQGFNASLNSSLSNYFDNFEVERGSFGLDVNYKYNKINVFTSYNYQNDNNYYSGYQNQIKYFNNSVEAGIRDANASGLEKGHVFKVGFDYNLSDNDVLTYKSNFSNYQRVFNSIVNYQSFNDEQKNNLIYEIDSKDNNFVKPITVEHNLNYRMNFNADKSEYVEFDAFYSNNSESISTNVDRIITPAANNPGFLLNQEDETIAENKQYIFSVDYSNSNLQFASIESGLRYEMRDNFDDYTFATNESRINGKNLSNRFDFDESILAAYFVANKEVGRFGVKLGLRTEYTSMQGYLGENFDSKIVNQNYFDFFPSSHISYKVNEDGTSNILLSYSRRIQRPSMWNVNPTYRLNENFAEVGNVNLKPQYTNSFDLGYSLYKDKYNLNFNTYYRSTKDAWSLYIQTDTTLTFVTQKNANNNNVAGVELSAMYNFAKWYRLNFSADFNYSKMNGGSDIETNQGFGYSLRMMNSFKVYKNTSVNLNAMYFGPAYISQGSVDPRHFVNLGVSQELFAGKGSVSVNVNDIFGGMKSEYQLDTPNYKMYGHNYWSAQMITVSLSYRFGDIKIKSRNLKEKPKNSSGGGAGL